MNCELAVIGGGPAGMAAALAARKRGIKDIIVFERGKLGGILPQCIHNGFGLHYFGCELTGPEYAARFIGELEKTDIKVMTDTMVLQIDGDRTVYAVNSRDGYMQIKAGAIVLAMGCRERTRGAIALPGSRPAGILCAGTAQRYINIEGWQVGKKAVILGSGDIGLIMARRLTLEGAKVEAVVEVMPYSGGLTRNIVQCLNDFEIPLYLSHTITDIRGKQRVTGVTVSKVDDNRLPIPGTEFDIDCDTLLLSVGLIPENELTKGAGVPIDRRTNGSEVNQDLQTQTPGIFACGNVLHVHDLVDFVSREGEKAGNSAADFIEGKAAGAARRIELKNGFGVNYTVPQHIDAHGEKTVEVFFRVNRVFKESKIVVTCGGKEVAGYKRERMAPGEMEKIVLPLSLLGGDTAEISAREEA